MIYPLLFVLFITGGSLIHNAKADAISNLLNQLQSNPSLNQAINDVSSLAQIVQQQQQNGNVNLQQALSQLSQAGSAATMVSSLTSLLSNLNWNQISTNTTALQQFVEQVGSLITSSQMSGSSIFPIKSS